jgi:uncharacterized protein YqjF (DUF2071 family)
MRQTWHDLLFVHWPLPPASVRDRIPPHLELDLHDGVAYVGLIAFTMTGVRPVGFPPLWGLSSFHETNLRTYVRADRGDPGVWFFSLDAASSIAVHLARSLFHLPYHRAEMLLESEPVAEATDPSNYLYAGVRRWPLPLPASYTIRAALQGNPRPASPGTLEHFLVERYIFYTSWRGRLYQCRVHHVPYPIQPANILSLDETILAAAGIDRPQVTPIACFSTGVKVRISPLRLVVPDHP